MNFHEYADRDMAVIHLASTLAGALRRCLALHELASFVVPGGTTPGPVFDVLSAAELDSQRVHVMLSDERWVPEDHERSNAGLVKRRLLTGAAQAATFVPFYRDGLSAEEAAPVLSEELTGLVPVSVLLLGMGADMHTASLFPGAAGLEAAMAVDAPLVCAMRPADQPEARISLSGPVLTGAMDKHLVIFGDEKRAALNNAMTLPATEAPAGAVIRGGDVHWAV